MFLSVLFFFFSSRRRHTRYWRDWSSDVCSSDLYGYIHLLLGRGSEDVSGGFLLDLGEQRRAGLEALLHLHARVLFFEPVRQLPEGVDKRRSSQNGQRPSLRSPSTAGFLT